MAYKLTETALATLAGVLLATSWSLALGATHAQTGAPEEKGRRQEKVRPELVASSEVMRKLASLGDNSSCFIGNPKIIHEGLGDWGKGHHYFKTRGPGGRDYTIKMAWMPDRKRAFFCGANHQVPHKYNDAWEYDLPSNTWVLLYVPDYNDVGGKVEDKKKLLVFDNGWLRSKNGGPAHLGHTWWGLTYDPQIKAALWYNAWPNYNLKVKLDAVGKTTADLYKGPPVWAFYPYEKKWKPVPTKKPWARNVFGGSLEFVPDLKGSLWQTGRNSWLLDPRTGTWTAAKSSKVSLSNSSMVCFDTHRKLMIGYVGSSKSQRTWQMPVRSDLSGEWKLTNDNADLPEAREANAFLYYDPVGKVALLYALKSNTIWAYEPEKTTWTKLAPKGPLGIPKKKRGRQVAYFDTARNVFVLIGADEAWCYRYRMVKAEKK